MQQLKNKSQIIGVIGIAFLMIVLVGVTYAFFNYTRTGGVNLFKTGNIYFNSSQNGAINLTNVFPMTSSEANEAQLDTVTVGIEGNTTYENGEEFEVTFVDVTNTINGKKIPLSYIATYAANIDSSIGTSSDTYWESRNNKDANIYILNSEGIVEEGKQVLVGFIKNGTTGISGTLTIKAYIDANRIAISDTYDPTNPGTDNMGTTTEWVDGRTVFTTEEWNSLNINGISFKIRAESQEGIWVNSANSFYAMLRENAIMDNIQSEFVTSSSGIDFASNASNSNGKGLYMHAGTENDDYPILYYRGNIYNNNVAFAGMCWLVFRTTDTGGIKMIYNGLQDSNGRCIVMPASEETGETSSETSSEGSSETSSETSGENDEYSDYIIEYYYNTRHRDNGEAFIEVSKCEGCDPEIVSEYNYLGRSIDSSIPTSGFLDTLVPYFGYIGYMYGNAYRNKVDYLDWRYPNQDNSGIYFGSGFNWDGTYYTLTNPVAKPDTTHRYSCNGSTPTENCTTLRYVYSGNFNDPNYHYIELQNGISIEQAFEKTLENRNNSYIKNVIDNWYNDNFNGTTNANKIEDTVYCNDRSINGNVFIYNASNRRLSNTPILSCPNKNDAFTVNNSKGNQALTYPVGLITMDELKLSGLSGSCSINFLDAGESYWTMTPSSFTIMYSAYTGTNSGSTTCVSLNYSYYAKKGIRPVISLKNEVSIIGGKGTPFEPYVIG